MNRISDTGPYGCNHYDMQSLTNCLLVIKERTGICSCASLSQAVQCIAEATITVMPSDGVAMLAHIATKIDIRLFALIKTQCTTNTMCVQC